MSIDELVGAITAGDLDQTDQLVRLLGPKCLDSADSHGMTPLSRASQMGNLRIVKYLLQKGAQADGSPSSGGPSVGVTSGGSSSHSSGNFRSPLVAATAAGHVGVVEQLLQCGAHVDSTHMYQMTCLHIACNKGYHKVVAALLDHGASINAQDKRGWTPLYHAAQRGHLPCVQLLLSTDAGSHHIRAGTHTSSSTRSASSSPEKDRKKSSSSSSPPSHRSMLQVGTPVWVRRKGQQNSHLFEGEVAYLGPVQFADCQDWVGVRLTGSSQDKGKNNGKVQGITYFYTETPHSGLFVRRSAVTLRRSRQLSDQSTFQCACQVNTPSFHRLWTPLHEACERGRLAVVKYLIDHGKANIHARDQKGMTPFFGACCEGHLEVVKYLARQFNDDVDSVTNNAQETPLWVACMAGNLSVVDFLLEKGANLNARNAKGISPLYMACAQERLEMVVSLGQRGADLNAPNLDGMTPLGWACLSGRVKLAKTLVQKGANVEAGYHYSSPRSANHKEDLSSSATLTTTPLWIASKQGNVELVRLLTFAGANLGALDPRTGFIPLAVAAHNGHYEVVHFLVLYGSQQQQWYLLPSPQWKQLSSQEEKVDGEGAEESPVARIPA